MPQGVTYEEAAAILGCHLSNVAKLIRKGELTSTGKRGASLSREQVEALAERRAAEREAKAARSPRRYERVDLRPDHEHEWLSPRQVAELVGVTRPGGASVKQVQERLGHASPVITLETYSHLWPGDDDRTRDVMDAALSPLADSLRTEVAENG